MLRHISFSMGTLLLGFSQVLSSQAALTVFFATTLFPGWQHHEISTVVPKCYVTTDTCRPALRDTEQTPQHPDLPSFWFYIPTLGTEIPFSLWKNSLQKTFYKTWNRVAQSLIANAFSLLLLRETRWNLSLFWKHAHLFMLLSCGRPLCLSLNSSAQFYAYMSPTHCLQIRETPINLEARGPEPNVHHPLMASQANVPVSLPLGGRKSVIQNN